MIKKVGKFQVSTEAPSFWVTINYGENPESRIMIQKEELYDLIYALERARAFIEKEGGVK
jgi:hypothetical protein